MIKYVKIKKKMDIWFNVLLHSNVDSIINFCLTSKYYYQFTNYTYFWLEKFKKDNLCIIDKNNSLMEEYKNVYQVERKIKFIERQYYFDFYRDNYERSIIFTLNIDDDLDWLPENWSDTIDHLNNYYEDTYTIQLIFEFNYVVNLYYVIYDEDGEEVVSSSKTISKSAVKDILKLTLYHLPNNKIEYY